MNGRKQILTDDLILYDDLSEGPIILDEGYCGIFLIVSGSIEWNFSATKGRTKSAPSFLIITDNLPSYIFYPSSGFSGYLLLLRCSYLESLVIDVSSLSVYQALSTGPALETLTSSEIKYLVQYLSLIRVNARESRGTYRLLVSKLLTQSLLYYLFGKFPTHIVAHDQNRKADLLNEFIKLVQQYGTTQRKLSFYANKLCITPKYLSAAISETSGKKCRDWIDDTTMTKARYLLRETRLPLGIISEKLNFSTLSDFTRYFRLREKIPPLQYRYLISSEYLSGAAED